MQSSIVREFLGLGNGGPSTEVVLTPMFEVCRAVQYGSSLDWGMVVILLDVSFCQFCQFCKNGFSCMLRSLVVAGMGGQ